MTESLALKWYQGSPNFGDEISPVIVQAMTGPETTIVSADAEPDDSGIPKLAAVGSVMHHLTEGTEVWGTGMMLNETPPENLEFHAVRGPKTRRFLLEHGYSEDQVPEVYGDPALLLPEFYTPKVLPWMHDLWVVIPHHAQTRNWRNGFHPEDQEDHNLYGFHIVWPQDGWETVVDAIANARGVISESLHGLIVADAYGVPNVWWNQGTLPGHNGAFKFLDYFESQNRQASSIQHYSEIREDNWEYLMGANRDPRSRNQVDLEALKAAFPYQPAEPAEPVV